MLGGGDEAILGVAIDKDVDLAAGTGAGRDEATGQENFAVTAAIEIKSRRSAAHDGQNVTLTEKSHVADTVKGSAVIGESIRAERVASARGTTKYTNDTKKRAPRLHVIQIFV